MLRIWLPLTKDTRNQGLSSISITGSPTAWNDGKLGKCAYWNGAVANVLYNNTTDFNYTNNFSVAFWANPIYTGSTTQYAWTVGRADTGGYGYGFQIINATTARFRFGNGSYDVSAPSNEWHHFVMTIGNNKVTIYKDGIQISSNNLPGTIPTYSDGNGMGLGCFHYSGNIYPYYGSLNDFRIYDHCLSPMEVKQISKGLVLHYPLDNNGVGGENLAINTNNIYEYTSTNNYGNDTWYWMQNTGGYFSEDIPVEANQDYILSFDYEMTNAPAGSGVGIGTKKSKSGYDADTWVSNAPYQTYGDGLSSGHFIYHMQASSATNKYIAFRPLRHNKTASELSQPITIKIWNLKLEKGSKPTPWCPNKNDALYSSMGMDGNIEYDCSGFGNNGTRVGEFSWSTDTPRYLVSTEFSGNSTCVRTSDNNWIARPIEEFTVNLWAYKDDWSTYGSQRLFSCTEGAGFNTEQISQSISFPINVYTNEARTSRQYTDSAYRPLIPLSSITSGWHMFTFTYSTSKISSYLDGELVDSKNYISYGAFCGDNIPLCIGAEATGNFGMAGGHFVGKISDFRLYYTELSDADVLSLYQASAYIDSQGNTYASSYVEG